MSQPRQQCTSQQPRSASPPHSAKLSPLLVDALAWYGHRLTLIAHLALSGAAVQMHNLTQEI
jgi:hypothetical protein